MIEILQSKRHRRSSANCHTQCYGLPALLKNCKVLPTNLNLKPSNPLKFVAELCNSRFQPACFLQRLGHLAISCPNLRPIPWLLRTIHDWQVVHGFFHRLVHPSGSSCHRPTWKMAKRCPMDVIWKTKENPERMTHHDTSRWIPYPKTRSQKQIYMWLPT